jgi:hypothetical protein
MSRRNIKKFGSAANKQPAKGARCEPNDEVNFEKLTKRGKYLEVILAASLLAFGAYHSILYFGYTIVPNGDFPAFFLTGKQILSLEIPSSFKRVPVLGILQVCLSHLVGGQYPDITAGWVLNAILHPFNLLLLWLVGKRIVGKAAAWFAIVAILSPQVLYLLTEPIVETTLLFFILLTFYFMFKRSNWCYFFASIATMTRQEGAALILACFVMDMIYRTSKPERIRALLYSVAAAVPLMLWMLGTFANWRAENYLQLFGQEYSKLYVESAETRTGFVKHFNVLWQTGFYPLLLPYPGASNDFVQTLWKLSMTFAGAGFVFGSAWGIWKRNWNILALLLFFIPYFVIHTKFPSPLPRYHMPILWIALLICLYGFMSAWMLIDRNGRVPKAIVVILQVVVVTATAIWAISLCPYLPKLDQISPRSAYLPYVGISLAGFIFVGRILICGRKYFLRELSVFTVMCLIIVSNQFALVRTIGDGQREKEFKDLANWYVMNAKAGEKMGLYMAEVVRIFAPKYAENIVGLPQADDPEGFVKACYKQNITYIVWATREGMSTDHTGYRQSHLDKNLTALQTPKDVGPYEFIGQVGSQRGYVNIFRLRSPQNNAGLRTPGG